MSIFSDWALNKPQKPYTQDETILALQIFRDMRGIKADPETEPQAWAASLEYARDEIANTFDMDQDERTGQEGSR